MTASPAQNAASLGNLGAKASAIADELRKLRERLRLNSRLAECTLAAAVAAANMCATGCRWLERYVKGEGEPDD